MYNKSLKVKLENELKEMFKGQGFISNQQFAQYFSCSISTANVILRKVDCIRIAPGNEYSKKRYNISLVAEYLAENSRIA